MQPRYAALRATHTVVYTLLQRALERLKLVQCQNSATVAVRAAATAAAA